MWLEDSFTLASEFLQIFLYGLGPGWFWTRWMSMKSCPLVNRQKQCHLPQEATGGRDWALVCDRDSGDAQQEVRRCRQLPQLEALASLVISFVLEKGSPEMALSCSLKGQTHPSPSSECLSLQKRCGWWLPQSPASWQLTLEVEGWVKKEGRKQAKISCKGR